VNRADLHHLLFLAGCDRRHLVRLLAEPAGPLWEGISREAFGRRYEQLTSRIDDDGIQHLLSLRLLSEYLLQTAGRPAWLGAWIARNLDVNGCIGPLGFESARKGKWYPAAVALMGDTGRLCWFVAGLMPEAADLPLWPHAVRHLLDEEARTGIANAAAAACGTNQGSFGQRLFCFPLVLPQTRLTGGSMGLPLALAFSRLLGDEPGGGCLATGAVDVAGAVHAAGNLTAKLNLAAEHGFKLFLYPRRSANLAAPPGVEALPVATLDEARMFAALHVPRHASDLVRLKAALASARDFIRDFRSLPPSCLAWARRHGRLDGIMAEIASSSDLFCALAGELRRCQAAGDAASIEHLAAAFPADRLDALCEEVPLAVFAWCCAGLWAANRRGSVFQARTWAGRAENLAVPAAGADMETTAGFACLLLLDRHNRFCFDPQLPAAAEKVLRKLEFIHAAERAGGMRVNLPLGRLYGTVCQNYAFCGPQWLEHTERYAALARQALGEESVPDYKNEWLRQDNHLAYAYLDAGASHRARAGLLRYLQAGSLKDLRPRLDNLSCWQHALLARFLADTPAAGECRTYLAWARQNIGTKVRPQHPWQLWLYNLGRLFLAAGDRDRARSLFARSLEICTRKESGATLQVMALLPLAGLHQAGFPEPLHAELFEKTRKTALALNPRHFAGLESKDLETALEELWQKADRYFPFAYR